MLEIIFVILIICASVFFIVTCLGIIQSQKHDYPTKIIDMIYAPVFASIDKIKANQDNPEVVESLISDYNNNVINKEREINEFMNKSFGFWMYEMFLLGLTINPTFLYSFAENVRDWKTWELQKLD